MYLADVREGFTIKRSEGVFISPLAYSSSWVCFFLRIVSMYYDLCDICSRIFYQYSSLSSKLSDNAMEVTQSVTQLQTQERKKFITHIKQRKTESIQVKKHWQEIVQNLTHER